MHIFPRLGCRIFQLGFRIALPLLPYRNPKTLHSLTEVAPLLQSQSVSSVLLVADAGVRALGLTRALEESLASQNITCTVYEQKTANPTIDNIEKARILYVNHHAQAIIAVGGGSAMDCAKVVGARIARPNKPVQKMGGLLRILRKTPLLIAVPTTAGTGSEVTLAAVITDSATHHKYPINDFVLIPDYAVLDPELTVGLPASLTATTGLDALTHAVEAYIGRSTTVYTRRCAEEAVSLIAQHLRTAVTDGQNRQARAGMLHAAYNAGIAFSRSYVGYVHAIAHSLGGQYGVPHGLANAVILPKMLRLYGSTCTLELARLARIAELTPSTVSDIEAATTFIRWIEQMNADFGIPTSFAQIRKEDIPVMARYAAREANPLYPVPMEMNQAELETVYRQLMQEEF